MTTAVYFAVFMVVGGLMIGLVIAARSFLAERADYVRTPPAASSRQPGGTGILGLTNISFTTRGGDRIAGWYAPSRNRGAVVLVHGTGADRSSLLFETALLARAGFGVLAADMPGQGASEGRTRWGVPERQAIGAAVDWLCGREDLDPRRIGGFGLSMGAYVLTQAAALDRRLRSLILAAPPTEVVAQNWQATAHWGLLTQVPCYLALRWYGQSRDMPPKDVIASIAPRAVCIIGGELDTLVPPFMARQLYHGAGDPKELWIVAGAHHGDYARVAAEEYRTRVTQFFERTLLD